jgi:taurine dioxygenase
MADGRIGRLAWREMQPFGIEIDFDFRRQMTEAERAALRDAFYRHSLVLARGQRLSWAEQKRVCEIIGPVLGDGVDYTLISTDGNFGPVAYSFHSDLSFSEDPFKLVSLHALDVVDGESFTRFASGILGYRALSPELRAEADRRRILTAAIFSDRMIDPARPIPPRFPRAVRDAVMKHPVTGAPILYVIEQAAVRVEGLPVADSEALLAAFAKVLFAPQRILTHVWRNGDFLFWDNLALQHARPDLTKIKRRVLQRVTVSEKSFFELCPGLTPDDLAATARADYRDPAVGRWAPEVSLGPI